MEQFHSVYSLQKRLLAVLMLVAFIFLLLVFRLCYLQVFKSDTLQSLAEEQWTRDLPISAIRGTIYDRNGEILAISYCCYDVYVRASNVEDPKKVASFLSTLLDVEYDVVYKKATNFKISESLIKLQITQEQANKIKKAKLKGVYLTEDSKRYYPHGDFLSQVLGYTTIDNQGQAGLELYYNKFLKGINGYSKVQSDIRGGELDNTLESYVSSISGSDLTLTIDYKIQKLCEISAVNIMNDHKPKSASIIVANPNTGEILAMTSKPSLDLNNLPRDNVSLLMQNSKNLSIVDVYEPGSTFKVLTTAAALEEGKTSLNDRFYDPGYRIVDGEKIKCWKLHGHGSQTMVDGLCNSCNSVFVDLSLRMGKDKMYEYFEKFGFGNLTNIDFAGETAGIIMNKEQAKKVDLARMGFGQAIAVSPLQQICAISSVLNGGMLMQPYFVSKISNSITGYSKSFDATTIRRVVSNDTSNKINNMMEQVIKKANGINAFIPGYRVGGKTGTTELFNASSKLQGEYIASFVGSFPADKPEYVILVVVDRPTSGAYYGSIVATPYAKTVIEGIIDYKNIAPTDDIDKEKAQMVADIKMPNVVGLSLSKAVSIIKNLGLQYEVAGEGGVITQQYPAPTTMMFKNGIVVLSV